jgi:hypothetical protein
MNSDLSHPMLIFATCSKPNQSPNHMSSFTKVVAYTPTYNVCFWGILSFVQKFEVTTGQTWLTNVATCSGPCADRRPRLTWCCRQGPDAEVSRQPRGQATPLSMPLPLVPELNHAMSLPRAPWLRRAARASSTCPRRAAGVPLAQRRCLRRQGKKSSSPINRGSSLPHRGLPPPSLAYVAARHWRLHDELPLPDHTVTPTAFRSLPTAPLELLKPRVVQAKPSYSPERNSSG